jgi:hypothetical protein
MKSTTSHRQLLRSILSGAYTPLDVREFVQLCYTFAVPLIRKKIVDGRLNLNFIRLKESDIVYDCLADLFRRNAHGTFTELEAYFSRHAEEIQHSSEQAAGDTQLALLRRLVFVHVNKNIIRLYSEVDPVLGKVLRNVKLAVEKTRLFRETERFGETVLIPEGVDILAARAPMPSDVAERSFTRVVLLHDNVMTMVAKLHEVLVGQHSYQRVLPLVSVALMFKKIYQLGWERGETATSDAEGRLHQQDMATLAQGICATIGERMRQSYVAKGKLTEEMFQKYLLTLQDILLGEFAERENGAVTYFEQLRRHLPNLTKGMYARNHRKTLEYLAKTAKSAMRKQLSAM